MNKPVLVWRADDIAVSAGNSWLVFAIGGCPFLRLRGTGLVAEFSDLLQTCLSTGNYDGFHTPAPPQRYCLDWIDGGVLVSAGGAERFFRLDYGLARDLLAWTRFSTGTEPAEPQILGEVALERTAEGLQITANKARRLTIPLHRGHDLLDCLQRVTGEQREGQLFRAEGVTDRETRGWLELSVAGSGHFDLTVRENVGSSGIELWRSHLARLALRLASVLDGGGGP